MNNHEKVSRLLSAAQGSTDLSTSTMSPERADQIKEVRDTLQSHDEAKTNPCK